MMPWTLWSETFLKVSLIKFFEIVPKVGNRYNLIPLAKAVVWGPVVTWYRQLRHVVRIVEPCRGSEMGDGRFNLSTAVGSRWTYWAMNLSLQWGIVEVVQFLHLVHAILTLRVRTKSGLLLISLICLWCWLPDRRRCLCDRRGRRGCISNSGIGLYLGLKHCHRHSNIFLMIVLMMRRTVMDSVGTIVKTAKRGQSWI